MTPFEHFVPGIQKALDVGGNTHTVEDVVRHLLDGEGKLFVDGDALIVAELRQYPRVLAVNIWLATGTLDEVIALSEQVLEWGRASGATLATFSGRPGWERALKGRGWGATRVEMHRRL